MAWTVVCPLCVFLYLHFCPNLFLSGDVHLFCSFLFLERWLSWLKNVSCVYLSRLMTKLTKWHVHPAKTQISLGTRPVWPVFAVRTKKAKVLSYPLSTQRRLWLEWVDANADPSLRWAQSFCWFCHEAAHLFWTSHFLYFWMHFDYDWPGLLLIRDNYSVLWCSVENIS